MISASGEGPTKELGKEGNGAQCKRKKLEQLWEERYVQEEKEETESSSFWGADCRALG